MEGRALESEVESGQDGVDDGNPGDDGYSDNEDEIWLEGKKEEIMINNLLEAGGAKPKATVNIQGWHKLQDQIKSDLELAEKKKEVP